MSFVLAPADAGPGWHATLIAPDGRARVLSFVGGGTSSVPPVLDGLVAAVLPIVMRGGERLVVRGKLGLTRGALRGLTEFTEAWANWRPGRYRRVTIVADELVAEAKAPSAHRAVIAWSGGLRSTHTLVRHCDGLVPGAFSIAAAVRVVGLRDGDDALDEARRALDELTVPLRVVWTNAVRDGFVDPEIGLLPIIAAALHLTTPPGTTALHARSWPFAAQMRYPRPGPAVHDLLGGDRCTIRAEGGAVPPPQMVRDVAGHPGLAHIVSDCRRSARACGRCAPCILTSLAFAAAGVPVRRPSILRIATLPFADPLVAGEAISTLAAWSAPPSPISTTLRARAALAEAAVELRDGVRWVGAATGLRAPWPR